MVRVDNSEDPLSECSDRGGDGRLCGRSLIASRENVFGEGQEGD